MAEDADSSETEPAAGGTIRAIGQSDDQAGRRDAADRAGAPGWALGEPNGLHLDSESTVHASVDPSVGPDRIDRRPRLMSATRDRSRWAPDA